MKPINFLATLFLAILVTLSGATLADNSAVDDVTVVNVNEADAATIANTLIGVGYSRAKAIVDYREQHGKFYSAEELTAVKGIGKSTVEKNLMRITTE